MKERKWFNVWDGNDWVNVGDDFHVGEYVGKCVAIEYRPDMYSRLYCMEIKEREQKDEMC